MADLVAKFSLNKRQEIQAKFDATNRPTISAVFKITKTVNFHNELSGREEDDCHPIKAITGLQNALDGKQAVIEDLETIRSGAAKGATALQPSALNNTTLTGNTTAEALKIDGYNALTTNSTLNGGKISEGSVNKNALSTGVQTSLDKADSAVQTIETGTANGTISVDGTDVEVKGLDSAAFTPASDYATAAQGEKADTAVQTVETGTTDGTISVDGTEVEVAGLGSAAFTDTDAYATAAQGQKADTAVQPATLNNYVTLNTLQTLTSGKKVFANDAVMAGNQTALLATISNSNTYTTDNAWVGRYICGAKNLTFLMGTYRTMAGIGAHSWTNAQTGAGASWADFYLNPDGSNAVYIGGNLWTKNSGWLKVKNSGNSSGTVEINRGTISSPTWKGVACWNDNVSKFNNDAGYITSADIPTTYIHEQGVASAVWTVQHNLNKYPSVTVVDSSENVIIADVEYVDVNTVKITMNGASKGRAYLN